MKGTKGPSASKGGKAPTTGWVSPFAAPTPPPIPAPAPALSEAEIQLGVVMKMLRNNKEQLPTEVQNMLHESAVQENRTGVKEMHSAVTEFGKCRSNWNAAQQARAILHNAWKGFIAQAVQEWETYMTQFKEEDEKLATAIKEARQKLDSAKKHLDEVKVKVGQTDQTEVVSDEGEEAMKVDSAAMIQENIQNMQGALDTLKNKAQEMVEDSNKKFKTEFGPVNVGKLTSASMVPFGGAGGV